MTKVTKGVGKDKKPFLQAFLMKNRIFRALTKGLGRMTKGLIYLRKDEI